MLYSCAALRPGDRQRVIYTQPQPRLYGAPMGADGPGAAHPEHGPVAGVVQALL